MIRVLVVDDHQAVRAGLVALLRQEPGFMPAATAPDATSAIAIADGHEFDVAVVDYHLPDASGVELGRRLPAGLPTVLYTAVPLEQVLVPALVAGIGGVVSKSAPAEELFDALRGVARGGTVHPPVPRTAVTAALAHVSDDDLPIVGMAIEHTPLREMAAALRIDLAQLDHRIDRVIETLSPGARAATARSASPLGL